MVHELELVQMDPNYINPYIKDQKVAAKEKMLLKGKKEEERKEGSTIKSF